MQDKIRMAKAKLIQVTTGHIAECQQHYQAANNKSLLLNATGSKVVNGGGGGDGQRETTEVATYEIYHQQNTTNKTNKLAAANNNNNMNDHENHHGHHHLGAVGEPRAMTSASAGTGLNNLDSGFDVDSSTCTATTTSKLILKRGFYIRI